MDGPDDQPPSQRTFDHNLNEIWSEVREQGESIAKIGQTQISTATSLEHIRSELRAIREIATRQPQPTNWVGIATLCLGILIAGGGYARSVIMPVKGDTDAALAWQTARSATLISDYRDFGMIGSTAKDAHKIATKNQEDILDLSQRVSATETQVSANQIQIRDVDLFKSRGWNDEPKPVK